MINFPGSSVYGEPVIPRKLDIVEKSPVSFNPEINFSNLSAKKLPERFLIYFGMSNESSSANSHG